MPVLASPFFSPPKRSWKLKQESKQAWELFLYQPKQTGQLWDKISDCRKHHIPPWTQNRSKSSSLSPQKGQQRHLSHSLTCSPWSSPNKCREGRVHFTRSICKGGLGRINTFLKDYQEGLCVADTPKACHLSTSCMPWNKFTAGTSLPRLLSLSALWKPYPGH